MRKDARSDLVCHLTLPQPSLLRQDGIEDVHDRVVFLLSLSRSYAVKPMCARQDASPDRKKRARTRSVVSTKACTASVKIFDDWSERAKISSPQTPPIFAREPFPPPARERGTEQKILPFLLEEIFGGARKIKMRGKIFCEAGRRKAAAGGGSAQVPFLGFVYQIW